MTEPEERSVEPASDEEEDEVASTPFDNPFFLPLILAGFALWLFYDGFLNQEFIQRNLEEGDQFAIDFNRYGAPILAVAAAWFTWRAFQERRKDSEPESD